MTAMDLFLQPEDLSGTDLHESLTGDPPSQSGEALQLLRSLQEE